MFVLAAALKAKYTIERLYKLTNIDSWFLHKMAAIIETHNQLESVKNLDLPLLIQAKKLGFSDKQIAVCVSSTKLNIRDKRIKQGNVNYFALKTENIL
jgi:hypothetical protein